MKSPSELISTSSVLGIDFMRFLLTPECVDPTQPPTDEQWSDIDFSRYGKTEADIKQFLERKAKEKSAAALQSLTGYFFADLLNQVMSHGLIYRLNNPHENGKAYYGIPKNVREALELEWAEPLASAELFSERPEQKETRTDFAQTLHLFLTTAATCDNTEIQEYAAQLGLNACQQHDCTYEELPTSLKDLSQSLGLIAVPHYADLTILLEACKDTEQFKLARQLCYQAVDANLLPAEDVDDILRPVAQPAVSNPFMVLT